MEINMSKANEGHILPWVVTLQTIAILFLAYQVMELRAFADAKKRVLNRLEVEQLIIRDSEGATVGSWLGNPRHSTKGYGSIIKLVGRGESNHARLEIWADSDGPNMRMNSLHNPEGPFDVLRGEIKRATMNLRVRPEWGPGLRMTDEDRPLEAIYIGTILKDVDESKKVKAWRYVIPGLEQETYPVNP